MSTHDNPSKIIQAISKETTDASKSSRVGVPLASLNLEIAPPASSSPGKLSDEVPVAFRIDKAGQLLSDVRPWERHGIGWLAPNFWHRPLYFEQESLERYGHYNRGQFMQSALSTAHFFSTIPLLPYKIGVTRPHRPTYSLRHELPGRFANHRVYSPVLSHQGVINTALLTTGLVFVVP